VIILQQMAARPRQAAILPSSTRDLSSGTADAFKEITIFSQHTARRYRRWEMAHRT